MSSETEQSGEFDICAFALRKGDGGRLAFPPDTLGVHLFFRFELLKEPGK